MSTMNVLFMFGPAHGKTMVLPESCDNHGELLWMEEYNAGVSWDLYDDEPFVLTRPPVHRYTFFDDFQNSNMEECKLYTHNDSCCEKVMDGSEV